MAKMKAPEPQSARPEYTTDYIPSDIERASFLGNPHMDNMMTALIAISAELWTNRRRMLVMEKLLADKGVSREMVEQFEPSKADLKNWEGERMVMIERIFSQFERNDAEFDLTSAWTADSETEQSGKE